MNIVSIGIAVPYVGVPHAGGEYYLRHVLALSRAGHAVTVVVPADDENRAARDRAPEGVDVIVVEPAGGLPRFIDWVNRRFRPAAVSRAFTRGLERDPDVRRAAASADLFELQWTQTGGALRALRRLGRKSVPSVLVSHDVMTQSMLRVREQHTPLLRRRLLRFIRWWTTRRDERSQADAVDLVLTFSDKDRVLLAAETRAPVVAIEPPLEPISPNSSRSPVPGRIVFVGAFDRHENADAAVWFLNEVWPRVRAGFDEASLRLVGANPTAAMVAIAAADPRVEVTGYVSELDPHYKEADLVVVPLLTGAGVKFKTVTAMIWGLPVVSTTVGAEGISEPGSPQLTRVSDDPARFVELVLEVLRDSDRASVEAAAVKAFALERYGNRRFERRLADLVDAVTGIASTAARAEVEA